MAAYVMSPATDSRPAPRGEMLLVDGRNLHIVRAGPAAAHPLVLLQAGSFGFSADWAVVQEQLTTQGIASLAYDRAGLGLSDPAPGPRDSAAIVTEWERLLAVLGETGPFILVGHSMAGLHVEVFAGRNRARVAGVVLVDAITSAMCADPAVKAYAAAYGALSRAQGAAAAAGLLKPFRRFGDFIGLTPAANGHKQWAFAHGPHNRVAADEVLSWDASVAQAASAGGFDADWPVAVVTAGPARGLGRLRELQANPARASANGYVDHIAGASHANMIGLRHAERVTAAIAHVHRLTFG